MQAAEAEGVPAVPAAAAGRQALPPASGRSLLLAAPAALPAPLRTVLGPAPAGVQARSVGLS